MKSLKFFFIGLFIITIFSLVSSYGFAVILPPFTTAPTTSTLAPGFTFLAAPTLPFAPTAVGGISFWPTATFLPTVAPTVPITGAAFPAVMWWGLAPTFPTFTPIVAPTPTSIIPTFAPTIAPTVPVSPFIPPVPTVSLVSTAPAPLTVPFGWPTGLFVPTTVPLTGGTLWPLAVPLI